MVLVRLANFWRITGVVHSDLKYMDQKLCARPTPEKNPLLSKKINSLYHLLTKDKLKSNSIQEALSSTSETVNDSKDINKRSDDDIIYISPDGKNESSSKPTNNEPNLKKDELTETINSSTQFHKITNYFENTSMRLTLPIPVDLTQRLLMVNIGDDFSHIWFPTWHKFLSLTRIREASNSAKENGKVIEMSQQTNYPKVFVTGSHHNQIFIGPYNSNDKQNIALFKNHNGHMMLSERYYKTYPDKYLQKSKGIY